MRRRLGFIWVFMAASLLFASEGEAQRSRGVPINIESSPPGATVYVDSASTPPLGVTPLSRVRVPRGQHTLIFRLANHEDGQLPVNVRRRRETFRIALTAHSTISVTGLNEGANGAAVRVDGQPVGNVPYSAIVPPGRHFVQVGREGYVTFSQWVDLRAGQSFSVPVSLEREAPQTGSLLVAGDVSGAAIYIDGQPRGVTPNVIENIPAGQHQIEIRPDDPSLQPHRQTLVIVAGERASINPSLRPQRVAAGSIRVIANAPGAIISLDGEPLGEAP
ncbi:MAG: PEGA domain-containing protein, partial [Myxococcales bacterium]|nr:PEGA domain-containing protein [Myxococcales bacterium]